MAAKSSSLIEWHLDVTRQVERCEREARLVAPSILAPLLPTAYVKINCIILPYFIIFNSSRLYYTKNRITFKGENSTLVLGYPLTFSFLTFGKNLIFLLYNLKN